MKIAVDAMGGDHGPRVVVEGAVAAVREFGASVILVVDRPAIDREVVRLNAQGLALEIRHASQVVGMAESPSHALRRKRDSSLRVAAELVKEGEASAFISAGNTGAAMAISMFVIGVLPGVDRPAIAAVLPNLRKFTILLDAGAHVDPKAEHLLQFAVVGHVEGRHIYNGRCDVVVTDGFTGNVALKISESLAEMLGSMIKEELMRDARSKLGAKLAMPAFERFRRRIDYTEMGGAPLLGIDGAAIICHGASPVKAIKNAVRVAQEWASAGLNEHIKAALGAEEARGGREGGRE